MEDLKNKENEVLDEININNLDKQIEYSKLNDLFIVPFSVLDSAYEQNPKYFTKFAEKQLFKKYKTLSKVISFNDKWETKQEIKQKKQMRREIKQTISFMLRRKRLRLRMEELQLKHEQLPKKIDLVKSSIKYERKFWAYIGLKIKTYFVEWFKKDIPEDEQIDKK